ncbi:MAG: YggS family pyridoxal phosphate-dependent enzyme [Phototrophicales bacterium]|nr:MAG: YggS family pyridoxal phosphate-dependent enzyme [Phototrophicales bacterium]
MIAENIKMVQTEIVAACARAGRDPQTVTLVAISKRKPIEDILAAVAAGIRHFGENRVEEMREKQPHLAVTTSVTWHMVGHIQSRKARYIPGMFQVVHSIDSLKLAVKLDTLLAENQQQLTGLIQMNVSGEQTKSGLAAFGWEQDATLRKNLFDEVQQITTLQHLKIRGLMTMAPIVDEMEQARPVFQSLARLREALVDTLHIELPELSMGMTDDYPIAIEEGATMIRVGRAIFGERTY